LSQAELASELSVTRAAVSAWVTGRAEPRRDKIEAIERLFGLDTGSSASRTEIPDNFETVHWYHRPGHADGGREYGDTAAFAFDGDPAVLTREATQNSLDERLSSDRPVHVRYVLEELEGEHLWDFLEALRWHDLEEHFQAALEGAQKVGRVLRSGLDELRETNALTLLRIEDYNASGLTGDEYEDGKFAAVLRRQLDSRKSTTAGGSYGLGKATLWSTSRFGLVLVNSTLSEPYEGHRRNRLMGRLNLPWHSVNGRSYAGPAWLGREDPNRDGAARSWWADDETVARLRLSREGSAPGTSFLIVGAHDATGNAGSLEEFKRSLVSGLAHSFWPSMVSGDSPGEHPPLEATVAIRRNGDVLSEERVDPYEYEPARSRAINAFLNGTTVTEKTNAEDVIATEVPLTVPALRGDKASASITHKAVLLVTSSSPDAERPNHVVWMRGNRMVLTDRRFYDVPLGTEPFEAILLAGLATQGPTEETEPAERFLRSAEPPEHNDWRPTDDLTATYVRGAATRIKEFRKAVNDRLREVLRPVIATSEETPKVLKDMLNLDPPPPPRSPGHPTVQDIDGEVGSDGSWRLRVEVRFPERKDPWEFRPVLRFVTRSGPHPRVAWADLTPVRGCVLAEGDLHRLESDPGARHATFEGVSDVNDHPVAADMAMVEVDLERGRGEER